jgi:NAD(P)-dependent dehydrogenase (short-subunit alcohol dehydrogenase family)
MKHLATAMLLTGVLNMTVAHAATVLVTGADRGLGLEFSRQYAARGDTVIATCRHPASAADLQALAARNNKVVIVALDVSDDANIKAVAVQFKGRPIDILINNAGVLGSHEDQTLGTFSRAGFHSVMDVNVFGALAVSEALRDNVAASSGKKIIAITSGLGSVAALARYRKVPYYYSMSKAALNFGMAALGADLKSQGVVVAAISPGSVDTDMLSSFIDEYQAKVAPISAVESVSKMIAVIDGLDQVKAASGVNNYDGTVRPW